MGQVGRSGTELHSDSATQVTTALPWETRPRGNPEEDWGRGTGGWAQVEHVRVGSPVIEALEIGEHLSLKD